MLFAIAIVLGLCGLVGYISHICASYESNSRYMDDKFTDMRTNGFSVFDVLYVTYFFPIFCIWTVTKWFKSDKISNFFEKKRFKIKDKLI